MEKKTRLQSWDDAMAQNERQNVAVAFSMPEYTKSDFAMGLLHKKIKGETRNNAKSLLGDKKRYRPGDNLTKEELLYLAPGHPRYWDPEIYFNDF